LHDEGINVAVYATGSATKFQQLYTILVSQCLTDLLQFINTAKHLS